MNSYTIQSGTVLELANESSRATRLTVRIQDGTELVVSLHPGAAFRLKDGTQSCVALFDDIGSQCLHLVERASPMLPPRPPIAHDALVRSYRAEFDPDIEPTGEVLKSPADVKAYFQTLMAKPTEV